MIGGRNTQVPMTRRHPDLPVKVLKRDSEIVRKLMVAWDLEHNQQKVLDIYLKEKDNLSPERYWEMMRTVWVLCGSVENSRTFRELMLSGKRSRYYFSTPEEQKRLREMPETFDVYRATNYDGDGGLSWTLSREYAEHYMKMYGKDTVITRHIDKKEVFALIERNQEEEILIL